MRRAPLVLLSALVQVARPALAEPVFLTGASASATWDSNVTRSAAPEGGLFLDATAHLGGGVPLAEDRVLLTALALYRGRVGTSTDALSSHVVVGSAAGSVRPGRWLRVGLSGGGGYTAMSDPSRDGPRLDGRAFFRVMPLDWLDLRGGYGFLFRAAIDPTFTTQNHELSLGLELRPLEWLELTAGWTFTTGGDVVFVAAPSGSTAGTTSGGRGRWASSDGTTWTPTATLAQTHAVSATALALLPKGFSAGLEFTWLTSWNALQPWTGWVGSLVLAWDLPPPE